MVGVVGFEPTISCSQSTCDARLRYTPPDWCSGTTHDPCALPEGIERMLDDCGSSREPLLRSLHRSEAVPRLSGTLGAQFKCREQRVGLGKRGDGAQFLEDLPGLTKSR